MHGIVYVDSARGIHKDAATCACVDTRTQPAMAGELELEETSATLPALGGDLAALAMAANLAIWPWPSLYHHVLGLGPRDPPRTLHSLIL